jgi:SNF2-related domain
MDTLTNRFSLRITELVDEGHRLKNHRCTLLSSLKKLKADNRLLLSGTPIQSKEMSAIRSSSSLDSVYLTVLGLQTR